MAWRTSVRVRQVPTLPYSEDFERTGPGLIPGGWTNAQIRYVTTKLDDGNTVLMKTARIAVPFYRQWYGFIGTPEMAGYTISADVMGEQVRDNLPNMGITAHRYILQLVGNEQKLRVSAWDAVPRVAKETHFDWEPNTWYRLKMTVKADGDSAHVLGKVWKRSDAEPSSWNLTLTDDNPNRTGPPWESTVPLSEFNRPKRAHRSITTTFWLSKPKLPTTIQISSYPIC